MRGSQYSPIAYHLQKAGVQVEVIGRNEMAAERQSVVNQHHLSKSGLIEEINHSV
jgi:hypothetical protein